MSPQFVKPYGKRQKNAAAEAIAEAVQPTVRFAPIKSADQLAVLMLHREVTPNNATPHAGNSRTPRFRLRTARPESSMP
jgi:hypothetical protein